MVTAEVHAFAAGSEVAMLQKIIVKPMGEGWVVDLDRLDASMVFKSGAAAERAARESADRLIASGERAELTIQLRDGAVAARFVTAPDAADHRRAVERLG